MNKIEECDLCKAIENKKVDKIWAEGSFYGLICREHKQPMIVLIEHRDCLTINETWEAEAIRRRRYPDLKFRGYMASIPQHWHDHLI